MGKHTLKILRCEHRKNYNQMYKDKKISKQGPHHKVFSTFNCNKKKNALSKWLTHECFNNNHPVSIGIAKNSLYMFVQPAKLGLLTSEKKNGEVILQFQIMPR